MHILFILATLQTLIRQRFSPNILAKEPINWGIAIRKSVFLVYPIKGNSKFKYNIFNNDYKRHIAINIEGVQL